MENHFLLLAGLVCSQLTGSNPNIKLKSKTNNCPFGLTSNGEDGCLDSGLITIAAYDFIIIGIYAFII